MVLSTRGSTRKRSKLWWWLLICTALCTGLALSFAAVVATHVSELEIQARRQAAEAAGSGLHWLRSSLNYRLTELRRELLQLNIEQAQLGRFVSEAERERLVLHHRNHLVGFAVLVPQEGGAAHEPGRPAWDVQKRYGNAKDADSELFAAAMSSMAASGTWLGRLAGSEEEIVAAFLNADEQGKPYGLVGVLRSTHAFPFCRLFGAGTSRHNVFVLDEQGRALCHSDPRFEKTSYKDTAAFFAIRQAGAAGVVHYPGDDGSEVTAAVQRLDPGPFYLVAEAPVPPAAAIAPVFWYSLAGLAGVILIEFLVFGLALRRRFRDPGRELAETVLSLQATQAFAARYQERVLLQRELPDLPGAPQSPPTADRASALIRFTREYLCSVDGISADWLDGEAASTALQGKSEAPAGSRPHVQPVYFRGDLLGVWLIAGTPKTPGIDLFECLPELAQVFGCALQLSRTGI